MSFARYFKLSSYALIGSGFAAIAATGAIDALSLLAFGTVLVSSWFIDTERLRRLVPGWLLNLAALAYFPLYAVDYLFLSRSFVSSTIHLVFYVSALKLVTRSGDRDYVYLYLISFAELLAASSLTIDVAFALSLAAFLVSGINTLVLFEMRRSNALARRAGEIQPVVVAEPVRGTGYELFSGFPAGSMAWMSVVMTVLIGGLAIPIFVLMPRLALGVYNRPSGRPQLLSGFSEAVELGEIGTIKESDMVVMRVRLNRPARDLPGPLKWRGVSLERYDGRSWRRSAGQEKTTLRPRGEYFKFEDSVQEGALLVEQTFLLEGLSTRAVFAARKALAISTSFDPLLRDAAGDLSMQRPAFGKLRYSAVSDVRLADPDALWDAPAPIPDDVRARYLDVPRLDPRIAELARLVTQNESHPYRKALALERYLKTNYGYSLELRGSPHASDPVAGFLFDVRRGHCEYFASALTLMLRQIGIPARLVNGFRMGEYNRLGDSWIVRQYDAHSWVEAYFLPYGWIELDPTPPDPVRRRPALLKAASDLVDAIDLWWAEQVVNYNFWKQMHVVNGLRTQVADFGRGIHGYYLEFLSDARAGLEGAALRALLRRFGLAALAAVLVVSCAAIVFARRGSGWGARIARAFRRRVLGESTRETVAGFYDEALRLLRSRGLTRGRSQTPLEFARSLGAHPASPPFLSLTELYNRIRFGASERPGDCSEAEYLLGFLREAVRDRSRSELSR